jgi:hypothetical protein
MGLALLAVVCLAASGADDLRAQNGVVFDFHLGYKGMAGDLGEILDGGVVGEIDFSYQANAFRYGIGFNLVSLDIVEPYDSLSVSQVAVNGFAQWLIRPQARLIPYLELRAGFIRYRPEGDAFGETDPDEEGENPGTSVSGFEGVLGAGVEYFITPWFALDLSAAFSYITTEEVDLSAIGLDPIGKGTAYSVRLGATWKP